MKLKGNELQTSHDEILSKNKFFVVVNRKNTVNMFNLLLQISSQIY